MLLLGRVPFPKQFWKNECFEKTLCFDDTIIPEVYVFGDTLDMNTYLVTAKCTHTEFTILHITYKQHLHLIVVGMTTIEMK